MHLSAPALEGGTVKQGRALPLNACMSIPPGRSTSPHSLVLSTSDLHLHMGPRTTGCGNIVSSRYLSFICLQGFFIFPAIYFADVRKDYLRPLGKTKMSPTWNIDTLHSTYDTLHPTEDTLHRKPWHQLHKHTPAIASQEASLWPIYNASKV